MNNQEQILTKAAVLRGIKNTETVSTSIGLFEIRPLKEGEKNKADAMLLRGIKASGNAQSMGNMNMEGAGDVMVANQSNQQMFILSCGLSVEGKEKWSVHDVENMTLTPLDRATLVSRIRKLSHMPGAEEVAENFRSDSDGKKFNGIGAEEKS